MIGDGRSVALGRRAFLAALAALPARGGLAAPPFERLSFAELYKTFGVLGYEFSDRVKSLAAHRVSIIGYMAPPLKAESDFFVLTREPLAICPFCESDANWPVDILVVYLGATAPLVAAGAKVTVEGRLDVGSFTDPESGFVSQLRVRDAAFRRV